MDKFQTELLAQLKEHNKLTKELVKLQRASLELSKEINQVNSRLSEVIIPQNNHTELGTYVGVYPEANKVPEPYMFSVDEIVDILVEHGQHDLKFSLGDTIKYSPSEIKHILLKEIEKEGEDNA